MEIYRTPGLATPADGTTRPSAPPAEGPNAPVATANVDRSKNAVDSVIVQQQFPRNTRLRIDEASKQIVAQILDENNEVVRQLPPQELLDISARFNRLEGILFDEQG